MTVHRATVADHMTRSVVAVGPHADFKEIAGALHQYGISAVPVVVGDNRVIGVVSEADLLPKEARRDRALHMGESPQVLEQAVKSAGLKAEELMTAPAVCVHADAPLTEAARIMARKHLKSLPVTDYGGRLTGIISRSDLLKVFLRPDEELAETVRREVFAGLVPPSAAGLEVRVESGVVVLSGHPSDTSILPLVNRLVRSVEGVVDVRFELR